MSFARSVPRWSASLQIAGGLVLLFLAERVFGEGLGRNIALIAGGFAIVVALVQRVLWFSQAKGEVRQVEAAILGAYGGVVAALLIYVVSTDEGLDAIGLAGSAAERTGGALSVMWPAVLVVSLAALLFMELAYSGMPVPQAVERRRIQSAAEGGLTLALSLVFLFSINYVASERDRKVDLSYFKTTRPSDSTIRMVRRLGQPVRVVLFYPEVSDVLSQLQPYFRELSGASSKLRVTVRDHALEPELARRHQIRGNGQILLLKGTGESAQAERFDVGTDLEAARSNLRTLDARFQRAFSKLVRPSRSIYLTAGHAERSTVGERGDGPGARTLKLMNLIRQNNLETQPLGIAQGLANHVPDAAGAVVVIGPRDRFIEEEARALLRYAREGGRVLLMLDPDVDVGLTPLLDGLGIRQLPGVLCSEGHYVRRDHTPADRGIVYSNSYSAHPTVTRVSRHASEVVTIFMQGAALERRAGTPPSPAPRVTFPLRSSNDFWRDIDGNFDRGPNEPEETSQMIAAVTFPAQGGRNEGRAVVIGDGDFITDDLIGTPGNIVLFADVIQWLIGEERIAPNVTSEEDIPIEHTRDRDKIWFYGTSFVVPILLLLVAARIARARRRRSEAAR